MEGEQAQIPILFIFYFTYLFDSSKLCWSQ